MNVRSATRFKQYSELMSRGEGEPNFRRKIGAENLSCSGEEAEAERRFVADLDPELALLVQLHLLNRGGRGSAGGCRRKSKGHVAPRLQPQRSLRS